MSDDDMETRGEGFVLHPALRRTDPSQDVFRPRREDGSRYLCPCCGLLTLEERGGYEICPVCRWEDDGQDDMDADRVRGGPNGFLSLSQARANFQDFGACGREYSERARAPKADELP